MGQEQIDVVKLAQDLKAGSENAKALLYNNYRAYFAKIAYRYVQNIEDTDDVICDSFLKIFKHISQLKEDAYLITWCGRVVATTAINSLRKRRYESDVYVINPGQCNDTHSPIDLQTVMKCIDKLAPGYKKVIELFCIEGLSGPEIAKELNMKQVTIRSQLFKARKVLKKAMRYEY